MTECSINKHYAYTCDRGTYCCVVAHDCERCGASHSRIRGCPDTDQAIRFDQNMKAIYPLYNSELWDK